MPRHHDEAGPAGRTLLHSMAVACPFPSEKAGETGETQPSDHRRRRRRCQSPSRSFSPSFIRSEKKKTRGGNGMRYTHAPNPTPKQLELESQADPILPIASPGVIAQLPLPLLPSPHAGRRNPFPPFATSTSSQLHPHTLYPRRRLGHSHRVFPPHSPCIARLSPIKPRATPPLRRHARTTHRTLPGGGTPRPRRCSGLRAASRRL